MDDTLALLKFLREYYACNALNDPLPDFSEWLGRTVQIQCKLVFVEAQEQKTVTILGLYVYSDTPHIVLDPKLPDATIVTTILSGAPYCYTVKDYGQDSALWFQRLWINTRRGLLIAHRQLTAALMRKELERRG